LRRRAACAAAAVLVVLAGCTALPVIERDECGNGIVETGEDCDSFSPGPGLVCRDPGSIGECRIDCRAASDGSRSACPPGWGCTLDAICRPPSNEFMPPVEIEVGGVHTITSGDFDGDGRVDLLARDRPDGLGQARLQTLYFDERGRLDDTRGFPKRVLSPTLHDVSGDGRTDLLFSTGRIGMILGRADRSLVPETFGSYRLPGTAARLLAVGDRFVQEDAALIVLTSVGGVPGFYVPQGENSELKSIGETPIPLESMIADPAVGNVHDDPIASPCNELVFAGPGEDGFWVGDACYTGDDGLPAWRDTIALTRIPIDPPQAIDGAPQLVDMNGDGHLDVLVGVGGVAYVAYGDGTTLAPAIQYMLVVANPDAPDPLPVAMPVAAGDFTNDGFVDFVFPNIMLLSRATPNNPLPTYRNDYGNSGAGWTVARIADLNDNGRPDVVAAGNDDSNIDFFNGSGTDFLVRFTVPTDGPVKDMAVADFDGDQINDLAFVELATTAGDRDTVKIAYGASAGPPLAPLAAARVENIEALSGYTELGVGNLIVDSGEPVPSGGQDAVLTLLETAGDRIPLAPYTLTSFSQDGSTDASIAFGLAGGHFGLGPGGDVLALASDEPFPSGLAFWLAPDILASSSLPRRMADLPATLQPIFIDGLNVQVRLASATADLDGDGRDESLWMMPYRSDVPRDDGPPREQCAVLILRTPAGAATPLADPPLVLDEPCTTPALLAVDADGDSLPDLLLLTGDAEGTTQGKLVAPLEAAGRPAQTKKQLSILWNDGQGGFTADSGALVSAAADSPEAFTALEATPLSAFRLAYISETAVRLVSATSFPRALTTPVTLAEITGATGIVAGDIDGDGIVDLAVAAAGDVQIVRAGLTQ
jgi:VCBS repeat protein